MRMLVFALVVTTMGSPCSARTILKSEPLVLAPYEVAYVQGASCPTGKVLKVTGAIRGSTGSGCASRATPYRLHSLRRLREEDLAARVQIISAM